MLTNNSSSTAAQFTAHHQHHHFHYYQNVWIHKLLDTFNTQNPKYDILSIVQIVAVAYIVQVIAYFTTGVLVQSFSRKSRPFHVIAKVLAYNARNMIIKCLMLFFAHVVIANNNNNIHYFEMNWNELVKTCYLGIAVLLLHDTSFFFTHYALHSKLLFKRFHAMHHTVFEPTGIDCYYESVVDHVCNGLFLVYMPLIFNIEYWVMFAFCTIETVMSVIGHSGLDSSVAQYHDIHHRRERYNYAALFPWWDMLFGTMYRPKQKKLN
jgi:sterol desaturase/sphingolipid hydroxylase (fatty acid hydroxylase superfamily)